MSSRFCGGPSRRVSQGYNLPHIVGLMPLAALATFLEMYVEERSRPGDRLLYRGRGDEAR